MLKFIVRRVISALPLIVLISFIAFSLVLLLPGDPALTIAGDAANDETLEAIRQQLGEYDPIIKRYGDWVWGAIRGDFGTSLFTTESVTSALWRRLPITLSLTMLSLVIALMISLPAGLIAGLKPGTPFDRFATLGASMGVAIPSFWLGLLLSVFFAVRLGWFPAIGYVGISENPVLWLKHLLLPAFSLGLAASAALTRQLRSSVIGVMQQDYIRTARAKGLRSRSVVFKHLLKNSSIPAVTALGLQFTQLLSGTVIIEGLFSLNGIGQYAVRAVLLRDLPVVQAVVLLTAVTVVISNLLVDISYGYLNPKTRMQ